MMRLSRPDEPAWLQENAGRWTRAWLARCRASGPREADLPTGPGKPAFQWATLQGRAVNLHLQEPLLQMTEDRCAYCDGFLGVTSPVTVDHFRPKARFPDRVYAWENLFPACYLCQARAGGGERWEEDLLKPDEDGYTFSRYFRVIWPSGRLEPEPQASAADRERARVTIEVFRLNDEGRPQARARAWRDQRGFADTSVPYRFLFLPRDASG